MTQVTPITGRRHCLKPTTSVRCFYTNLHLRIKNFCVPEHLNVTVRLNEVKFKGKLYYVVKFDRPDPERGIPDKRDKLLCKNSVPNKNRPESEASGYLASGYLRLHCILEKALGIFSPCILMISSVKDQSILNKSYVPLH